MEPKPRHQIVIAQGNARELVSVVESRDLSRIPGERVDSLEKNLTLKAETDLMLKAVDAGGFQGKYPRGLALAHHQIKVAHYRLFVVRVDIAEDIFQGRRVFINPRITNFEGNQIEVREGCLSHPFKPTRKLKRWDRIRAEWEGEDGSRYEETLTGLAAQIFQHETDHCDGKTVWIDSM